MDDIISKFVHTDQTPYQAKILDPLFTKSFSLTPRKSTSRKSDYYLSEIVVKDGEKSESDNECNMSLISTLKDIEDDSQSPLHHFKTLLREAIFKKNQPSAEEHTLLNRQVFLKSCSKLWLPRYQNFGA